MQSMGRRIVALMAFLVGALGFVELSHGHALQPGYLGSFNASPHFEYSLESQEQAPGRPISESTEWKH